MITRADVVILNNALRGFNGRAWHIKINGIFYVVAALTSPVQPGTMIFPADQSGTVVDWLDIVSIRNFDHEAAIALLLADLNAIR